MEWLGLFCDVIPVVIHSRMDRVLALRPDCLGSNPVIGTFTFFYF